MKILTIASLIMIGISTVHAAKEDWRVGLQCYTFKEITLLETADYCEQNGIEYLEIYPGQKIGGDFEGKTNHDLGPKERKKLLSALKDRGVSLVSYGCVKATDEAGWDKIFSFCKDMGIRYVISEPAQNQMKTIDKLLKKYSLEMGIHNHKTPTPDDVEARLQGISNRVGIAPDTGHWQRHGHDVMASLKRFEGRMKSLHLKDVNEEGKDGPYGTGSSPIADILSYLDASDYKGQIILEYESGNEKEDVKKCFDYLAAFISGSDVGGNAPEPE